MKSKNVTRLSKTFPKYFANKIKNPNFVIGAARSGTTLLRNLLTQIDELYVDHSEHNNLWHPNCYPYIKSNYRSDVPPHWFDVATFTKKSIELRSTSDSMYIKAYFGGHQFFSGKKYFINKSAMLTHMVPYISDLFPNARFIHIERNPYAVIRSDTERHFKKIESNLAEYRKLGYAFDYEELLKIITNHLITQLREIQSQINNKRLIEGENYFHFYYEDLCDKTKETMENMLNFIGIDGEIAIRQLDISGVNSRNYKFKEMDKRYLDIINNIMEKKQPGYSIEI